MLTGDILIIEQGTISFGIGFFLVLIGWPIFGMILKAFGFVVLFRFVLFLRSLRDALFFAGF